MSTFGAPYGSIPGAGDMPARPPIVRENVVASKEFFAANSREAVVQAAAKVFIRHWGDINQFILGQRQMGMVLPASYKRKDYGDLSMEYQRFGVQETVLLTAYPQTENPNPLGIIVDLNFDGYVAWIHHQNREDSRINGIENIVGPFDIFFNGYLIEQDFAPTLNNGGYVLMFGPTALRAESYQDDDNRRMNDLNNSNSDSKIKEVVPRPGWGKFPDGSSPTGVNQDNLTKELGYWIFDFTNSYNPCSYFDTGSFWQTWQDVTRADGLPISLSKGLWFEHPEKSPLDYKGPKNTFAVLVSPVSIVSEVLVAGVIMAEFYDRNKQRTVTASWKYDSTNGQTVIVNDSPLIWGQGYTGVFFNGTSLAFDLTPKADKPDGSTTLLGPHDGLVGAGRFPDADTGLDPDDQARLDAWRGQVHRQAIAYNNSIQQYITAWINKWNTSDNRKKINQAENVEAWFNQVSDKNGNYIVGSSTTTGDITGQDRVNASGVDRVVEYGPVQQYWWDWNAPYTGVGPLPKITGRYAAIFSVVQQRVIFFDTLGNPGNPTPEQYGGSFPGPQPASVVQMFDWAKNYIKDDPIHQREKEYQQIFIDHPPPPIPPRPTVGKDYTKFSYRHVAIGDSGWSFPAKFSGDN